MSGFEPNAPIMSRLWPTRVLFSHGGKNVTFTAWTANTSNFGHSGSVVCAKDCETNGEYRYGQRYSLFQTFLQQLLDISAMNI